MARASLRRVSYPLGTWHPVPDLGLAGIDPNAAVLPQLLTQNPVDRHNRRTHHRGKPRVSRVDGGEIALIAELGAAREHTTWA